MRIGLLPAAGRARRLGIDSAKELLIQEGRPIIDHSVEHLLQAGVDHIVVVTRRDKPSIKAHLVSEWPEVTFVFCHQDGEIGNLIDGLRAATSAVAGHDVLLLFPDTIVSPNPFSYDAGRELTLLCHDAPDSWQHFGVVDERAHRVVEKPRSFVGERCWGAALWRPSFTERLAHAASLTDAINRADWRHARTIDRYVDIGLKPRAQP